MMNDAIIEWNLYCIRKSFKPFNRIPIVQGHRCGFDKINGRREINDSKRIALVIDNKKNALRICIR